MCMCIKKINGLNPESKKSKLVADFRKGYKVICKENKAILQNYQYKIGENISSRHDNKYLEEELNKEEIIEGFHIFLELKDALRYCGFISFEKVIEVFYKDENVVSYGYTPLNKLEKAATVVSTKLIVKSFINLWYPYLKE